MAIIKPKMILFDYYHTLVFHQDNNSLRGISEVMRHAVRNPQNLTDEEVDKFSAELFKSVCEKVRDIGAELNYVHFLRLMYEYLQIEFDIPMAEVEQIYWDNAVPGAAVSHANDMLAHLYKRNIGTGVISNIRYSGDTLTARLNRLLPDNHFEFVIASSEYMLRKPNPMLFELALRKAGLTADEVWFCGDSLSADIAGAISVGIFPVWYEYKKEGKMIEIKENFPPTTEYLHIQDWRELVEVLDGL